MGSFGDRSRIPRSNDGIVDDIQGTPSGDPRSEILVIYNCGSNLDYPLPAGAWSVAMEKSVPVQTERVVTGTVTPSGPVTRQGRLAAKGAIVHQSFG